MFLACQSFISILPDEIFNVLQIDSKMRSGIRFEDESPYISLCCLCSYCIRLCSCFLLGGYCVCVMQLCSYCVIVAASEQAVIALCVCVIVVLYVSASEQAVMRLWIVGRRLLRLCVIVFVHAVMFMINVYKENDSSLCQTVVILHIS